MPHEHAHINKLSEYTEATVSRKLKWMLYLMHFTSLHSPGGLSFLQSFYVANYTDMYTQYIYLK